MLSFLPHCFQPASFCVPTSHFPPYPFPSPLSSLSRWRSPVGPDWRACACLSGYQATAYRHRFRGERQNTQYRVNQRHMAEPADGYNDSSTHSTDSYHETIHIEPIYEAFLCPLTKKIMHNPVTLETGQTFESEAIEKWLRECNVNGKPPTCPVTGKVLGSTELNPSIALRNTIEEWTLRNEVARLDVVRRSLFVGNSETDALQALDYVIEICLMNRTHKNSVRRGELIPLVADMLKSTSRRVRLKALETLRILAEEDDDNKENLAVGDTIRTIVKFLSHEHSQEREEAVSLLYELSKNASLCEKIGDVSGAILILLGMSSSKSENVLTVERAEKTLENLERYEKNVRQMAENGRLRPLLTQLLQGSPDTQLSMAAYLGELVLSNDVKVFVAETAGSALVNVMRSGNKQAREAALKALNQISSYETSAKILIEAGILPPLVKDLFMVGSNQLPMRLKEVSATILANLVACGANFESIPLDHNRQTLVSEDIVHNLLHLISNTGPAIECKLLQVLVGLTSSSTTILNIVAAIKSSGATISLIQFIEAPQREVRMAAIKLLNNISPHMGQDLADSFRAAGSQLSSLVSVMAENNGISDEQAAAAGLLADLPERDSVLTRRLLEENAFMIIISKVRRIRQGEIRGGRFATPFLEGLVRILYRVTYMLDENNFVVLAQEHNLAALFTELLQMNGVDKVQAVSAAALENLSQKSKHLTRIPEPPQPGFCCFCLGKTTQDTVGICRVHHGFCSIRGTFCLLDGKAVEKLVSLLDHTKEQVVEAALAAICTLLEDGVDIEEGVVVLCEAEGIRPILEVLCENRTEVLRQRAVWAVERILRREDIAYEISGDQNVGTALVEAFRNGDYRTRQIAERALKLVDKLPNFSGIFTMMST